MYTSVLNSHNINMNNTILKTIHSFSIRNVFLQFIHINNELNKGTIKQVFHQIYKSLYLRTSSLSTLRL